jgi:hypothetical protein
MTFDDILDQVITLLKRQGRMSYGAMKRRFDLDDAYLEDLKGEILLALSQIFVWRRCEVSAPCQGGGL